MRGGAGNSDASTTAREEVELTDADPDLLVEETGRFKILAAIDLRIPTLEGERIRLEPLAPRHSHGMFALWSEATVCEYAGPSRDSTGRLIDLPARSRSESNRLLHYWIERAEAGTGFRWAVILNDNSGFAGAIGFNTLGPCSEYAYHFVPRFWGAGLATEASRLALSWCSGENAGLVEMFIEPGNARSIRLAERLGFERQTRAEDELPRYVLSPRRIDA